MNNFIDRLSQENFVAVLNAIHLYASNKVGGNINNNLIAIGMFQNVADYIAKQIMKKESSQDASFVESSSKYQDLNEINFEQVWEILFKRIENLSSDHRTEVRCTNIHTLENIIMIHGASFAPNPSETGMWRKIMLEVLEAMLTLAVDKYTGVHTKMVDKKQEQPAMAGQKPKSKTFEEASVVKALQ